MYNHIAPHLNNPLSPALSPEGEREKGLSLIIIHFREFGIHHIIVLGRGVVS